MADFDLTQTDEQVQSILNDAQDAMGAGAQTSLTTDYIMLKDTSGNYHKILKDSFTEACRNVLAGLLVNNDKGTTISQIAAIASGDFGSVTPANLASVLGVEMHIKNYIVTLNNNESYTVTVDNALVYVVCNGDWKLVALSYNNITEIAGRSGERFSLTGDNTTFTITSSYSGSLKFGIFVFYRG